MNPALPFALIIGIDQFAAKNLAEELSNKDINVIGVGDYVAGLDEIDNFELLMDLSEVSGKFNYVFDFLGEEKLWGMDQFKGEKVTMISVNNKDKAKRLSTDLEELNLNWRLVEAEGVYGPGMEEENFLTEAIKLAVVNKNLVLPDLKTSFRILAIEDLVEAILRASFLSGTEKEKFLIWGKKTNSEEVARVLIDEAKMTRYKVLQKQIEVEEVDEEKLKESMKKLRWEPKVEFKDGVVKTLQYFFSRADEENRRKKIEKKESKKIEMVESEPEMEPEPVKEEPKKREMEVVVEEEEVAPVQIKKEEKLEEIENFYKQKKPALEIEKIKPEAEVDETFDDDFEEILPTKPVRETPKWTLPEPEAKTVIVEEKKPIEPIEPKKPKPVRQSSINGKLIWLFLAILMILIVPINWTISTVLAVQSIKQNVNLIEAKNYSQVETSAENNLTRIKKIDQEIDDWGLNKLTLIRNYQTLLKVGEDVLKLEKDSIGMSQSADLISQAIFKERAINFNDELAKEEDNLASFQSELGLVLARLNGDYSWLPAKWRISLQNQAQSLTDLKEKLDLASKGIKILPEFLGLDGKRRDYLVLFQNENELRATGGFIGSYGILSFQGGNLVDFKIKDVYEADGQLKGHVEPPIEIKNYLGEANWFMRDANWNPDFVKSAADIQWFLNEEVNQKVDGVIGINLAVAKSIMGVIGEVKVPDFNKTITKDNLYEQAEYFAESKFFPGSTQKASFLGTLGNQMFEEIKELKTKQQLNLVSALIDLLEKNEIQMAFNNQDEAKITADLGWNGAMYQGKCLKENCFSDYLFVVDSNFGVNKTNYFLNRDIEQMVDIGENTINRTLMINYENTAKNTNFPGGDYKNYLRIYLPDDVVLSEISLVDSNNSNLKKIYTNDELRIKDVDGKKEIGFLVTVPVLTKKTVEVKYSSPNSFAGKDKFSYVSYVQKQSGSGETGLTTLVSFPNSWQPLQVEPQASMVGGKLLFNQKLETDLKMGVEFGK